MARSRKRAPAAAVPRSGADPAFSLPSGPSSPSGPLRSTQDPASWIRPSQDPLRNPARWAFAALAMFAAVLAWRTFSDLDFGIHVASGRWIVAHRQVPQTDAFTWTVPDHRYVAYHWLFQVALYGLEQGGVLLLTGARWLLVMATFLLIGDVVRRRHSDPAVAIVCGLIAILASEWRFDLRPELVSYLLIALTLWLLERQRRGDRIPVWALASVQLVWVNSHIYVFGWAVMAAYAIEAVIRTGRLDRWFLQAYGLALLAVFVNPYHLEAVLYPMTLATRMDADNLFARHISELASPFGLRSDPRFPQATFDPFLFYKVFLGLGVIAIPGLLRRRCWADLMLLLCFGGLSSLAVRNGVLFIVATLPGIVSGLEALLPTVTEPGRRITPSRTPLAARWREGLLWGSLAIAALLTLRVVNGRYYGSSLRLERFGAGIAADALAVDAADWLERSVVGRGFNDLNMGGTLMWRDLKHPVFIDGRNEVTGEAFFRRYLELTDPQAWRSRADAGPFGYRFDYAILTHKVFTPLIRAMLTDSRWRLVYLDGVAAILVRTDGPNGHLPPAVLPSPLSSDERFRVLSQVRVDGGIRERVARELWPSEPAPGASFQIGTFLLTAGQWQNAERPLLEAILRSPHAFEAHNNLGALYFRTKDWEAALRCYRHALMLKANAPIALERAAVASREFDAMYGLTP